MGERGRALIGAKRVWVARLATAALVLLGVGTIPGAVVRPSPTEHGAPLLPVSPEHDAVLVVEARTATDGTAISHARVRVLTFVGAKAFVAGEGETNAAGHSELRALPRSDVWVTVEAASFARFAEPRVLGGPDSLVAALVLGHRLSLAVVDDLSEAVPNAEIEISGKARLPIGAKTDLTGHAETDRLEEGPWTLSVRAPGFEPTLRRGVREGETPRVVLRKLGALTVRVLDEHGAPVPLAHVAFAGASLWPPRTTDTKVDGTVRIGGLVAGSYAVRATSGDLVSQTDLGIPLGRGEEREVELRLARGRFIVVRAVEETDDGPPLSGVRLTLVEGGVSPFPIEGASDSTGTARLGPITHGVARLSAQADQFVPRGAIEVPPDGAPVSVVMVRAGSLVGRVVDERGRPVDGASIEVVGTNPAGDPIDDAPEKRGFQRAQFNAALGDARALVPSGELGVVPGPVPPIPHGIDIARPVAGGPVEEPWVTKDDGTFVVAPVTPGRVRVLVRHPEYIEALSDQVVLLSGAQAHVDVVLHEGGAIDGRVVDHAGRAVAGATVTLAALRGSVERRTRAASDGTFAFAAVPNGVVLTASLSDETDGRSARSVVDVPERGKRTVTLTLGEARPPLPVHVRDDRGYPVGAAQISIASIEPSVPLRTTAFTDSRGDATVAGARGVPLRLEVSAPGHSLLSVMVAESASTVDVTLRPAQTVTGVVRESHSGAIVVGASVTMFADEGARRTETDAEGRFRLIDVAPGSVRLVVRAKGLVSLEQVLTVVDAATHAQDVGYVELGGEARVSGNVVDSRGNPVPGARVGRDHVPTFVPVENRDPSFVQTDSHGRFRLGGLPEGSVALEAYAPDLGRARLEVNVVAGRVPTEVTLRLAEEDGERVVEPAGSGGVAITLGENSDQGEVLVVAVAEGSEAERASLAPGDVLVSIDGTRVHTIAEARGHLSGPLTEDVVVERRRGTRSDALRVPREAVHR